MKDAPNVNPTASATESFSRFYHWTVTNTADPNGKQNPALEWWMQTMNESLAEMLENGEQPDDIVLKDGYKTEVAPLLSTAWEIGRAHV